MKPINLASAIAVLILCSSCFRQEKIETPVNTLPSSTDKPIISNPIKLNLQSRKNGKKKIKSIDWHPSNSVILLIDMWKRHACLPAHARAEKLAVKINSHLPKLRAMGVQVIHSASGTIGSYLKHKARKNMEAYHQSTPQKPWNKRLMNEPPIPIIYGCNGYNIGHSDSSEQNKAIEILDSDLISDSCTELLNYFEKNKIKWVFYAGVHTNICVISRPCGMRNLSLTKFQPILIRDLVDSVTGNRHYEYYTHDERNKYVNNHIEEYIAPSVQISDLIN